MYSIPSSLERVLAVMASSVNDVYLYSVGLAPCAVGYSAGRYFPSWARALPLIPIVLAGTWYVLLRAHWFEVYWLGTIFYGACCFYGATRRSGCLSKPFWSLRHFDWILLALWMVLFTICYGFTAPSL